MILKLLIALACAELWRQGGKGHKLLRVVALPFVISAYLALTLHTWWLLLALFGVSNIYRVGYGIPDATDKGSALGRLLKIGWVVRAVVGGLYALLVGGVLLLTGFLSAQGLMGYTFLNVLVGGLGSFSKLKDEIFERLIGFCVGSIVFLV